MNSFRNHENHVNSYENVSLPPLLASHVQNSKALTQSINKIKIQLLKEKFQESRSIKNEQKSHKEYELEFDFSFIAELLLKYKLNETTKQAQEQINQNTPNELLMSKLPRMLLPHECLMFKHLIHALKDVSITQKSDAYEKLKKQLRQARKLDIQNEPAHKLESPALDPYFFI